MLLLSLVYIIDYQLDIILCNLFTQVPNGGYRKQDRQSALAIKWLQYISMTENIDIQHARNGGEVRAGKYKLDGIDRKTRSTVFEFYGCTFHGCKRFVVPK